MVLVSFYICSIKKCLYPSRTDIRYVELVMSVGAIREEADELERLAQEVKDRSLPTFGGKLSDEKIAEQIGEAVRNLREIADELDAGS